MPSKETVEGEVSDYINDNIHWCLGNFNPFLEEGFTIEVGNVKSSTILNKNKAFFSLEFPLTIKRGPQQKKLTDFSANLDTKFGLMFDSASILTKKQTNDPDNICMDCLYREASKNNLIIELSNIYNDTVIFSILDNNTGEQLIYANKYVIYTCSNPPIDADSSFLIDCLNEEIMNFNYQFQVENISDMNATVHESFYYKVKAIGLNLTFEDYSPLFVINEKTGNISFIPSEEQIGNHTIWIHIRDGLGNKKYIDFNLKIIKNE